MKWLALFLVLLAGQAWAVNDGDDCPAGTPGLGSPSFAVSCKRLCAAKTTVSGLTCGPIEVNNEANNNFFFVQTVDGCGYDNIEVGLLATTTTPPTVAKKVLGIIDDDLVVNNVTGQSAIFWPFKLGMKYAYVSAGDLAGCSGSNFEIWLMQW